MNRRGFLGLMAGIAVTAPRAPSLLYQLFAPKGHEVVPLVCEGQTYLLSYVELIRRAAKRELSEWFARTMDEIAFRVLSEAA